MLIAKIRFGKISYLETVEFQRVQIYALHFKKEESSANINASEESVARVNVKC